jgi:predicted alpha/beta superfamily hydrolase
MARDEPGAGVDAGWRPIQPLPDRDVYHHASTALGETLEITVVPPVAPAGARFPVLYVLDPFMTLDMVVGWSRVYARYSDGDVPHAFVVGIGYPTRDDREYTGRRIRDLTPTSHPGSEWKPPLGAGHGPKLIEAIASEIAPFVETNYLAGTDRTVVGWSLGGLFALTALFRRPGLFQRYLIVSPSLWWDRRWIFAEEAAWAAAHTDLPARLFMAVGSEEQTPTDGAWQSEGFSDEIIAWFRQVANFRAFSRRLRARRYGGLRLDAVMFRGEYHMTGYPAAVARGLVKLFEP